MGACGDTKEKENPKSNQLSDVDKAVFDCKKCRDTLKNYIKKLERSEKLHKDNAKNFLKEKNRPKAKLCLNKSKIFASQIESANNNLTVIEEQILRIEQTKSQQEVMKVLDQGNSVLKELQKEVNIEKWENIRDDMDDIKAQQEEIGDFLKSHNINESEYETELNKDLERLMEQEGIKLEGELPSAKNNIAEQLPEPAKTELKKDDVQRVENVESEAIVVEKKEEKMMMVEEI